MPGVIGDTNPLVPAANRFAVGPRRAEYGEDARLSPRYRRAYPLRFAEPLQMGKHDRRYTTGDNGQ